MSRLCAILSAESFARGERLWKYAPKVHLIEHLACGQAPIRGQPEILLDMCRRGFGRIAGRDFRELPRSHFAYRRFVQVVDHCV
eukprot:6016014-Pyramimonas_sp.AAC.1